MGPTFTWKFGARRSTTRKPRCMLRGRIDPGTKSCEEIPPFCCRGSSHHSRRAAATAPPTDLRAPGPPQRSPTEIQGRRRATRRRHSRQRAERRRPGSPVKPHELKVLDFELRSPRTCKVECLHPRRSQIKHASEVSSSGLHTPGQSPFPLHHSPPAKSPAPRDCLWTTMPGRAGAHPRLW